jgi:hypothetical protein
MVAVRIWDSRARGGEEAVTITAKRTVPLYHAALRDALEMLIDVVEHYGDTPAERRTRRIVVRQARAALAWTHVLPSEQK